MTNQEAIETLRTMKRDCRSCMSQKECDAIDAAIAALEKQIPKKPTQIDRCNNGLRYGWCPSCPTSQVFETANYCKSCGQRLNWKGES